jgi:integrase
LDKPITTRAARDRLPVSREPYWRSIEATVSVGYRRGATGGTWLVRVLVDGRYREQALGRADDSIKPDGVTYLDYRQAEVKARQEAANQNHVAAGIDPRRGSRTPYTVANAMEDYLSAYKRRGGKSVREFHNTIMAHVLPELGPIRLDRLTRSRVTQWRDEVAAAAPRLRTRAGSPGGQKRRVIDPADHDAIRARRATANRVLSVLKAALNFAHHEGRVQTKAAWETVKPFREVNAPRIRHLTDDEVVRLVNACDADLRQIVVAGMLTGMRYGEITRLRAADFGREAGIVTVTVSKSGNPRHIYLTDEGQAFFDQSTSGRPGSSLVFTRANGEAWGKSHQFRPLREACAAARIEPAISFHILRHTYASRLALAGTPMTVIAAQLGHTDTRMTERHYAHLTPNYVADVVHASFTRLGIVPASNVASLEVASARTR